MKFLKRWESWTGLMFPTLWFVSHLRLWTKFDRVSIVGEITCVSSIFNTCCAPPEVSCRLPPGNHQAQPKDSSVLFLHPSAVASHHWHSSSSKLHTPNPARCKTQQLASDDASVVGILYRRDQSSLVGKHITPERDWQTKKLFLKTYFIGLGPMLVKLSLWVPQYGNILRFNVIVSLMVCDFQLNAICGELAMSATSH